MKKHFLFITFVICALSFILSSQAISKVVLLLPNGQRISQGMSLPSGYYWVGDGTLITPQKIMVGSNGDILSFPPDLPLYSLKNVRERSLKLPDDCMIEYETDLYDSLTPKSGNIPGVSGNISRVDDGMLFIPEEAISDNDLSFMNGCWRSDGINYYTDPKRPYVAPAEFCFNGSGEGTFYAYPKGTKCVSNAMAYFQGELLIINTSKGSCEQGRRFLMPRTFQCEGTGKNTMCYTVAKYDGRVFHDRAIFYKK